MRNAGGERMGGVKTVFAWMLLLLGSLCGVLPPRLAAQGAPAANSPFGASAAGLITIRLEKRVGTRVDKVAQNTVFKSGEILRFRLTSSMAGYLYVVDKGSTGTTSTLFPGASALRGDNRIEPGRGYLVPADGNGWFEVSGPAGFDVLYFLVSATPMNLAAEAEPEAPGAVGPQHATPAPGPALSPDLLPRCNDEIFKSRGECLDDSAGPAALAPDAPLPREIGALAGSASRDIVLSEDESGTEVRAGVSGKLPLVYVFRLAHR